MSNILDKLNRIAPLITLVALGSTWIGLFITQNNFLDETQEHVSAVTAGLHSEVIDAIQRFDDHVCKTLYMNDESKKNKCETNALLRHFINNIHNFATYSDKSSQFIDSHMTKTIDNSLCTAYKYAIVLGVRKKHTLDQALQNYQFGNLVEDRNIDCMFNAQELYDEEYEKYYNGRDNNDK